MKEKQENKLKKPKKLPSTKDIERELENHGIKLHIPGWDMLGDVMVIDIKDAKLSREEKKILGELILKLHPVAKAVVLRNAIKGELREPEAELIGGEKSEAIYKEHGCIFKFDATKVMFSLGNKEERKRMGKIVKSNETVADFFACVGQFSIPVAKHGKAKRVYAIEKNKIAFEYLKENIKLNKVESIVMPILGDCRYVALPEKVDRVILGYIFDTEKFLSKAIEVLKDKGMVHYHSTCLANELDREEERVIEEISEYGASAEVVLRRIIKSYAPSRVHYVLDISVEK